MCYFSFACVVCVDLSVSTVARDLTSDERLNAETQYISIQPSYIHDDSVRHKDDLYAGLHGFIVSNSPIASINGTYLEAGVFDSVPMYRHVRGWVMIRDQFPEMPELGISTADIEDNSEGFNKFFNKAGGYLLCSISTHLSHASATFMPT
jgi:hypothetical protein